jgi:outer membrane lipoprotein SlyB
MNNSLRIASLASACALAVGLTACGTPDPYGPNNYPVSSAQTGGSYPAYQQPAGYVEYGRVTNVSMLSPGTTNRGSSTAGTLLGAVVGGALGNQIGSGGGRAAATILGAVGGAAVGGHLANNNNRYNTAGPVYRVSVQTDQGQMRTYDVSATGDLRPGDRVRIENGVIYMS